MCCKGMQKMLKWSYSKDNKNFKSSKCSLWLKCFRNLVILAYRNEPSEFIFSTLSLYLNTFILSLAT